MVEKGKETKVKVKVTEEIGSKSSGPLGRIRKKEKLRRAEILRAMSKN
jgi:hypothetical protein